MERGKENREILRPECQGRKEETGRREQERRDQRWGRGERPNRISRNPSSTFSQLWDLEQVT